MPDRKLDRSTPTRCPNCDAPLPRTVNLAESDERIVDMDCPACGYQMSLAGPGLIRDRRKPDAS
jgi:hypothetical protein